MTTSGKDLVDRSRPFEMAWLMCPVITTTSGGWETKVLSNVVSFNSPELDTSLVIMFKFSFSRILKHLSLFKSDGVDWTCFF